MTVTDTNLGNKLRWAVLIVALLNACYGVLEFIVALHIESLSLFADSIDFFEDASVNFLIFFALAWSTKTRARVGMLLACILLLPALAGLAATIEKLNVSTVPDPFSLGVTGVGALLANLFSAYLLSAYRTHSGSLSRAAFLSARNDALANIGIVGASFVTALVWISAWPDIIVGVTIAAMNADAAKQVWKAARREHV